VWPVTSGYWIDHERWAAPATAVAKERIIRSRARTATFCRAALAVEAAGIADGADASWRMHDWLFARSGEFSDDELHQYVRENGLDERAFFTAFHAESTLALIRADTDTAGLRFTPLIFLNGKAIDMRQ
jgi:hypothetical protein